MVSVALRAERKEHGAYREAQRAERIAFETRISLPFAFRPYSLTVCNLQNLAHFLSLNLIKCCSPVILPFDILQEQ
jgi:hypothetical protein